MPKQIWKIENFHGGLNSNSDPRDVADNELSAATDIMVDELGKVRTMGSFGSHDAPNLTIDVNAGYGLHYFTHDRRGAENGNINYSGSHTGSANQDGTASNPMVDASSQFIVDGLIGATILNLTDGSSGTITDNAATTVACSGGLSGGTGDDWDNGDTYTITNFPTSGDDYLIIGDTDAAASFQVYSAELDLAHASSIIDLGSTTGMKPAFYSADGTLRISDGNFGANNDNQWYGYVYSKLYQTVAGVPEHLIDRWVATDQELKSFDDLGVDLVLDDCSAGNPDATSITDDNDRLVIGWWTSEGGDWKGKYYIGVAPVFIGGQEGPISIPDKDAGNNDIDGTITINSEVLNIQVFVCQGDSSSVATNSEHLLKDYRIIGFKIYTKAFPSETWYLLKEIDLIQGGKFGWAEYNVGNATGNGSGVMGGTHGIRGTDNDIYARFDNDSVGGSELTMEDAGVYHEYEKATAHFEVNIGDHTFGQYTDKDGDNVNREGQLRVSGFHISPVYGDTPINLNSAAQQDINISGVVLPTEGVATFYFEILDENFNTIHKQDGILTIIDSGGTAPDSGDPGGGGDEDDPYSDTYF